MKRKSTAMLVILILSFSLIGAILGEFSESYGFLSFLGYGTDIGFENPITINLYVINLTFALLLRWNIGSIIGTLIGIIYYIRL